MMKRKSQCLAFLLLAMLLGACIGRSATPTSTPLPLAATTIALTATSEPTLTPTSIPATLVASVTGLPTGAGGYPWWNDTIFYEIFVRSFYDLDGNGIGDFNGITAKLDYLHDLGVTGLVAHARSSGVELSWL